MPRNRRSKVRAARLERDRIKDTIRVDPIAYVWVVMQGHNDRFLAVFTDKQSAIDHVIHDFYLYVDDSVNDCEIARTFETLVTFTVDVVVKRVELRGVLRLDYRE